MGTPWEIMGTLCKLLQFAIWIAATMTICFCAVLTFGGQAVSKGIGFFPNQSPLSVFLTDASVTMVLALIAWYVLQRIKLATLSRKLKNPSVQSSLIRHRC